MIPLKIEQFPQIDLLIETTKDGHLKVTVLNRKTKKLTEIGWFTAKGLADWLKLQKANRKNH